MELDAALLAVSSRFIYRADRLRLFDSWRVMPKQDRGYEGDCEDFSLTVFWLVANQSILTFLWNLLVTHRFSMTRSFTSNGDAHVVGNIGDQWFDNYTKVSMPREQFFQITGHRKSFSYPGPLIALYLLIGLFVK